MRSKGSAHTSAAPLREHPTVSRVNVFMQSTWDAHKWLKWSLRMLIILGSAVIVLAAGVRLLAGHLRDPLIRYAAAQTARPIRVEGRFDAYLFSLHPRLVAEQVIIGNPAWTPPGTAAQIGRLSITYDLPWFGRSFGVHRLEMQRATLHLFRDEQGRSNWQLYEPGTDLSPGPPLIRSLAMPDARVEFDDERRNLKFEGMVSAQDAPGQGPRPALQIDGSGTLNGRAASFTLSGDPLATVTRGQPYRFEFTEASSGTRLTGRGIVPHPFDFRVLETTFEAGGEDMKDLFFLTGVHLLDTGTYHLSGKLERQDHLLEFTQLDASSGQSDVHGTVSIDTKTTEPSHIEADLQSHRLRVSDLGQGAAGRAPEPPDGKRLVLPDTAYDLAGTRRSNAVIDFHGRVLEVGHVAVHSVAAKVRIEHGVISAAPVSAVLRDGKMTGELRIDATGELPGAEMDLRVTNLQLGRPGRKEAQPDAQSASPPPLEGPVQARVILKGRGSSIHEVASNASGTVTAVLPHGALRSSLAELAGFDLRGIGLMAAGSKDDTAIRCGVASFGLKDGTLTAERLVLDTGPVLITGAGTIDLASEAYDLQFQGRPKHPRLRVRAPLLVRGTFGHPSIGTEVRKPALQAAGAIALGILLTPVASMLAFVDPGLAKDTDCAALLAEAGPGA